MPRKRGGRTVKKKKNAKIKHKKLAAGAAVVVLAAGAAVHENFELDELLSDEKVRPRVEELEREEAPEPNVLAELPEEEYLSRADALRGWFIRLPVWVKSVFLLPLWALGTVPAALAPALGPVWDALAGLGVQLGVMTGLFCLVYKLLFPDRKVRELFRKKNLKWLFLGAVTVTAADVVLTQLWTDWPVARVLGLAAVGMGVLCLLWKRLCGAFRAPEPKTVKTRLVME